MNLAPKENMRLFSRFSNIFPTLCLGRTTQHPIQHKFRRHTLSLIQQRPTRFLIIVQHTLLIIKLRRHAIQRLGHIRLSFAKSPLLKNKKIGTNAWVGIEEVIWVDLLLNG